MIARSWAVGAMVSLGLLLVAPAAAAQQAGDSHPAKPEAANSSSNQLDLLLDQVVSADSKQWSLWSYDRGSMHGSEIVSKSEDGSRYLLRGYFTYAGNKDYVLVQLEHDRANCISYGSSSASQCELNGASAISSDYQAILIGAVLLAALPTEANSGSAGITSSRADTESNHIGGTYGLYGDCAERIAYGCESGGDVIIEGKTKITATAVGITALENGSMARTQIGSISGSAIKGDTTINATAGSITGISIGEGATAVTDIGTIKSPPIKGSTDISGLIKGFLGTRKDPKPRYGNCPNAGNGNGPVDNAAFIPWPPPAPSAKGYVTEQFRAATLGGVAKNIEKLLRRRGYPSQLYFAVRGGFAILTPLERIAGNGMPIAGENRWKRGTLPGSGSILQMLWSAIQGDTSRFRVILFIVTPQPFETTKGDTVTDDILKSWELRGDDLLSGTIASQAMNNLTKVSMFVYEFDNNRSRAGGMILNRDDAAPIAAHANSIGLNVE